MESQRSDQVIGGGSDIEDRAVEPHVEREETQIVELLEESDHRLAMARMPDLRHDGGERDCRQAPQQRRRFRVERQIPGAPAIEDDAPEVLRHEHQRLPG